MKFKNYYDRTDKAREIVIDTLATDGTALTYELLNSVTMVTGLGERWLTEFLDLLKKMGKIEMKDNVVTWLERRR